MKKNTHQYELYKKFLESQSIAKELQEIFNYFKVVDEVELRGLISGQLETEMPEFDRGLEERLKENYNKICEKIST